MISRVRLVVFLLGLTIAHVGCVQGSSDNSDADLAAAFLATHPDPLCDINPPSPFTAFPQAGTSGFSAQAIRLGTPAGPRASTQTVVAVSGETIENRVFTNPDGICLVLRGVSNVVIRNNHFINCKQAVEFIATPEAPLRDILIRDNLIEKVNSGIIMKWDGDTDNRLSNARNVVIYNNRIENILKPTDPEQRLGGAVGLQFIRGCGIAISNNSIVNTDGLSSPSDLINLYSSAGKPGDPINIEFNLLRGGRIPSVYHDESSGGIVMGDGCQPRKDGPGCVHRPDVFSEYQRAAGNVLIDPGKNGLGIGGGRFIFVEDNIIYGRKHKYEARIGLAHYDTRSQYCESYGYDFPGCVPFDPERPTCRGLIVRNNRIHWWSNRCIKGLTFNADGTCGPLNDQWDQGSQLRSWPNATHDKVLAYCGPIEGVDPHGPTGPRETNTFNDVTIDPNDFPR